MQIVIDIPEEEYEHFLNEVERYEIAGAKIGVINRALQKGTPLPKGHGRLIDEDDIRPIKAPIAPLTPEDSVHYEWVYMKNRVENAPTIIEADKAEGECE